MTMDPEDGPESMVWVEESEELERRRTAEQTKLRVSKGPRKLLRARAGEPDVIE